MQVNEYIAQRVNQALKIKEQEIASLKDAELKSAVQKSEIKYKDQINELNNMIAELNNSLDNVKKEAINKLKELTIQKDSEKNLSIEKIKSSIANDKQIQEIEFQKKLSAIQLKNATDLNALNGLLKEKQNQIDTLTKHQELEIASSINKVQLQYKDQINNLQNTITELNGNIISVKKEANSKINELTIKKDSEKNLSIEKMTTAYEAKIASIKSSAQEEINELKVKNAENRILQSKTKGENWENEVENELRASFGYIDKIEKITKSTDAQKADYLQIVRNSQGQEIGKLVYEVKNARWSDSWIPKLVQDVANNKTKYGILVTSSFSEKFHLDVGFVKSPDYENIWIADPWSFIFVAQIIRKLIEVENNFDAAKKQLTANSDKEMYGKYIDTVNELEEYMTYELPKFIKSFNKQVSDLEAVENSLNKNVAKISKVKDVLSKKFNKEVKERLEKITDKRVIFEEDLDVKTTAGVPEDNNTNLDSIDSKDKLLNN